MKKIVNSVVTLTACLLCLMSCKEDEEVITTLSIDKTEITMGADGDFKVALSLLGASLSISADFDTYAEPSEALGTLTDDKHITSGNNAELVEALAKLGCAYMPSFAPAA